MASTCPKCNGKLKVTDWRPNCPHCGVNLVYYGMEERLLLDADKAEAEHAHFQKKIDRLKASFVGDSNKNIKTLAIIRIVLSVLPIAALMIPMANLSVTAPFISEKFSINAINIYNVLSSLNFDALFGLIGSDLLGASFITYAISIVSLVLALLMVLAHLILLMLSCSPKGKSRNFTLNILTLVFATVSFVSYILFTKNITAVFPTIVSGGIGVGIFVFIALVIACFVVNILLFSKGIDVKYKQVFVGGIPSEEYFKLVDDGVPLDEIRAEMAKRTAAKEAEEAAAAAAKKAEEEAAKTAEEAVTK